MTDKDEIAALRAELNKLKPTEIDEAAMRQWQSDMHELRERRASGHNPFSRADIEAMRAACPDDVARDIAMRDGRAPTGRPGMIPSNPTVSNVNVPVNTSGWRNPAPLTPPPGVAHADRLMAAEDREFRRQRIIEEAQRRALFEGKKPSDEASDA